MKFKSVIQYIFIFTSSLFILSCNTSGNTENELVNENDSIKNAVKNIKAQEVFYSIPSPLETVSLLKTAGAKYNAAYLNAIENVSKYTTVTSKALNLGIYGSDLSFTSIFDQTQEAMLYLRCTNKLAAGLGINEAFNENTVNRIESNVQNRDSLLAIISDSYWTTDAYLKDNGQHGVAALIVAGGWIEGLYIGTRIANSTHNKEIIIRIGEQKLSLINLIELLDNYKADNAGITAVLNSLKELNQIYASVEPEGTAETIAVTNEKDNITSLDDGSSYSLTAETLKQITDKIAQIRAKVIQ